MATVRLCVCARRLAAVANGDFVFLPHAGAWVFTDGDTPRRELTWRARYYLAPGQPDMTGEPFRYVSCPWCGNDLPSVVLESAPEITGLGDPENG